MADERKIAYFSMEIGLDPAMPTYSGGLGVLAGDTLRSAADMKVPMVGVTLLCRDGYFHQELDESGRQSEQPETWKVEDFLAEQPQRVSVRLEGREVRLRAWQRDVKGAGGFTVPVYFLDSDLPENSQQDRALTHDLYGGDAHYRLCQEAILGIGGVRMLRELGYKGIERYHMNEGHAAFLALELLEEQAGQTGKRPISADDLQAVRERCVFTTHTPVPAGQDRFPRDMVADVIGRHDVLDMPDQCSFEGMVNMTCLALNLSHYVNGVAKRHGEVSRLMFAQYKIDSITNGVHAATWTSGPFQELYDHHIPGWREDNFNLRYALSIPRSEIWSAHEQAKAQLLELVNRDSGAGMQADVLTLGFARRATAYKRADLLFQDVARLREISARAGRIQAVYAGKAHPRDEEGKKLIQHIFAIKEELKDDVPIAYLPNYNMELGRLITSGVDVWLNTPQPPMEASGTSGMKAALNGVPSLSILDGWWIEGRIEGLTGWAIGEEAPLAAGEAGDPQEDRSADAASLYQKLADVVVPTFYHDRERFLNVMAHSIALNGSFFNTQRMIQQYVLKAYYL